MKKLTLTFVLSLSLFFTLHSASAAGVIIYGNGEKIEMAQEFPAEVVIDDEHVNLGVMYEQFSIFWVPIWNYGKTEFVFVNDTNDTYWELTAEDVETLKSEYAVEIPAEPTIGFWNRIGGKLVWGAVILALIWGTMGRKKSGKKEEE